MLVRAWQEEEETAALKQSEKRLSDKKLMFERKAESRRQALFNTTVLHTIGRERETERESERECVCETERERENNRERKNDRKRDEERDREGERERDRGARRRPGGRPCSTLLYRKID